MHNPLSKAIHLLLVSAVFTQVPAFADRSWNDNNNPSNFDPKYVKNFSELPLNGGIDPKSKRGWADSYWPKVNGAIADRWQVKGSFYKNDVSPNMSQLPTLSEDQLNQLSPGEKFDIARGKNNFPIVNEIRKTYKVSTKDYHGFCFGWAHASLNYDEPRAIDYTNPKNNIKIHFGSSDIKGLLAYYHQNYDSSKYRFIGKSCTSANRLFNLEGACTDVHPAAFHIMMANELGIKHLGFAADRDPGVEIWNQPFVKFESRIDNIKTTDLSANATDGTRKEVYITSILTYTNELYDTDDPNLEDSDHVLPSNEPVLGTAKQKYRTAEYKYVLELNSRDRIIGGEWISEDRPDVIWTRKFKLPGKFTDEEKKTDDWSLLAELVRIATSI